MATPSFWNLTSAQRRRIKDVENSIAVQEGVAFYFTKVQDEYESMDTKLVEQISELESQRDKLRADALVAPARVKKALAHIQDLKLALIEIPKGNQFKDVERPSYKDESPQARLARLMAEAERLQTELRKAAKDALGEGE